MTTEATLTCPCQSQRPAHTPGEQDSEGRNVRLQHDSKQAESVCRSAKQDVHRVCMGQAAPVLVILVLSNLNLTWANCHSRVQVLMARSLQATLLLTCCRVGAHPPQISHRCGPFCDVVTSMPAGGTTGQPRRPPPPLHCPCGCNHGAGAWGGPFNQHTLQGQCHSSLSKCQAEAICTGHGLVGYSLLKQTGLHRRLNR